MQAFILTWLISVLASTEVLDGKIVTHCQKRCDIFRATTINLGAICNNLNQRKSSGWRNSQDLIGIFCSGPFPHL